MITLSWKNRFPISEMGPSEEHRDVAPASDFSCYGVVDVIVHQTSRRVKSRMGDFDGRKDNTYLSALTECLTVNMHSLLMKEQQKG